jgi:TorA maturation chaperone TorD
MPRKPQPLSPLEERQNIYRFLAEVFMVAIAVPGHDFVDRVFGGPLVWGKTDGDEPENGAEDEPEDLRTGGRLLQACAGRYARADRGEMQKEIAIDRTWLCRGIDQGRKAPPPPYEALYLSPRKETDHLLKVVAFYQKAGLQVSHDARERMDYLGLELAFMAELCGRENRLAKRGGKKARAGVLALEKEFLEEHLLLWVPEYCRLVIDAAKTDFFRGIACLLRGFLREERERTDGQTDGRG